MIKTEKRNIMNQVTASYLGRTLKKRCDFLIKKTDKKIFKMITKKIMKKLISEGLEPGEIELYLQVLVQKQSQKF